MPRSRTESQHSRGPAASTARAAARASGASCGSSGRSTPLMHVPVALGVGRAAATPRRGRTPWALGAAWGAAGALVFVSRARAGMADSTRHPSCVPHRRHPVLRALVRGAVDASSRRSCCAPVSRWSTWRAALPVTRPASALCGPTSRGCVVSAYGVLVRRRWFRVVTRDVKVAGLPAALDGLRVAHLSDLHIGTLTPRAWGLRWARAANAAKPDLSVVTGDLVTSGTAYDEAIADVLGALRGAARRRSSSMGNHDYFGEEEHLVAACARGACGAAQRGRRHREGRRAPLARRHRRHVDPARRSRPRARPAPRTACPPCCSRTIPSASTQAADAGVELVLSGHTHGGQVACPSWRAR